jgi:hypothetical protein
VPGYYKQKGAANKNRREKEKRETAVVLEVKRRQGRITQGGV